MKNAFKVLLFSVIIIGITWVGKHFYELHLLENDYAKSLNQKEDDYINSFYKSSFKGIITYIKKYEESPIKYVIGILDSSNRELTIGKVVITNFSSVMESDTVSKKNNSFELEILTQKGKVASIIVYE